MDLTVVATGPLEGSLRPPSDKSLTHRAYMLASISKGDSVVRNPLRSADCETTLRILGALGMKVASIVPEQVRMRPAAEWNSPSVPLDCGNSGTTMRLLAGLIASRPIEATLTGDNSLSKRPMGRIAEPLRKMGAHVEGDRAPILIRGTELHGIEHHSPVASAQIKSCLLLAGLRAEGETWVDEPFLSRDHTERMLQALGVHIQYRPAPSPRNCVGVTGGQTFEGFEFSVPSDISSAAFPMVAAALIPGSKILLSDVGINPTRTGILDVFDQCGMGVEISNQGLQMGEPTADLSVFSVAHLHPFEIGGAIVPRLIDEIPILSVLATQCQGTSVIRDAAELRVKESDRLAKIAIGLRAMGAQIDDTHDGLVIHGPTPLCGARIDCEGDHRIAMAFAIAGMIADGRTMIQGAECIATSYPDFEKDLWGLCLV